MSRGRGGLAALLEAEHHLPLHDEVQRVADQVVNDSQKGSRQRPLGRHHRLEVAAITLFLCSPAARYINGASIVADGGYYFGRWTDMHDPEAIS